VLHAHYLIEKVHCQEVSMAKHTSPHALENNGRAIQVHGALRLFDRHAARIDAAHGVGALVDGADEVHMTQ